LEFINDRAQRHNVAYAGTYGDEWAKGVARVLGDDVELDDVGLTLIALNRAGILMQTKSCCDPCELSS
jgi:hypothetical protein